MASRTSPPVSAQGTMPGPIPINDLGRHVAALRPVIEPVIAAVIESGWFILGPRVEAFEAAFASFCGTSECVGVANGTDAMELALRSLGIGPGDEVITVANAGGYSTAAISAIGASPVYAEIDPTTLQMDPDSASERMGSRTAAVIATHLYGRTAPLERLDTVAKHAGIPLIEDCAQAHGASVAGRPVGSWGTLGCFSFYPTKNLGALGDGGAVVGSDPALMTRVRRLRQYGWQDKYRPLERGGRNSRLDELQAGLLAAQLPLLEGWNQRRHSIGLAYADQINHPRVSPIPLGDDDVMHLAVFLVEQREALRDHLGGRGVGTDIHYPQPDYAADPNTPTRLEHTESACRSVVTLPCFPEMTDREVETVIEAVNSWRS